MFDGFSIYHQSRADHHGDRFCDDVKEDGSRPRQPIFSLEHIMGECGADHP
jgi:hypothetical protein